ncbi:anti-sigma factor family protein [Streptomyces sp. NPDC015220]|uniref:anti-sigma factor family protein n=1 Tax=Streptomyces sp. NPDC015220 TaxID=3364947 RepID=UPI0036F6B521
MTSTTDTAGHPDVTELSDLTEGLLTPSRAEGLRQHLDECDSCADTHASLEEIRDLLGTLRGPREMPSDIADRIDAALAAESGSGGDSGGSHVSRETSAVDRPAGHAGAAAGTGPGRKARARRGRRRVAVLGAAFAVVALGVASVILTSSDDHKDPGSTAHGRSSAIAGTFSEATLGNQVSSLLRTTSRTPGSAHPPHSFGVDPGNGTGTNRPNVLKSEPTVPVPSCVRQGISSSESPLAAKAGTYDGKDAYLVVLPDAAGDATRVAAYIVDATCVHQPSNQARVLLSRSYTRS